MLQEPGIKDLYRPTHPKPVFPGALYLICRSLRCLVLPDRGLKATNTSGPKDTGPKSSALLDLDFKPQNVPESLAALYPQIPNLLKVGSPAPRRWDVHDNAHL